MADDDLITRAEPRNQREEHMEYNDALAKAKEFASETPRPVGESEYEREAWEHKFARRLQFDAAYNECLQVRVDGDTAKTDDDANACGDREWELTHLILTMPVVYDWMIFRKLEIINYHIMKYGEVNNGELMALTALDGIKADILRLWIFRENKLNAEAA
jgi:hypothetical protein